MTPVKGFVSYGIPNQKEVKSACQLSVLQSFADGTVY
jgi:hypothetical protein